MRKLAIFLAPLMILAGAVVACSDDDDGDTKAPTTTPDAGADTGSNETPDSGSTPVVDAGTDADSGQVATRGAFTANVTYTGAKTGTLNVAFFTSPASPPVDGVQVQNQSKAQFPYKHDFTDVIPGDYLVYAFLDVGNNNPGNPGAEDPQPDNFTPVTVVAGQTASITIDLGATH